MDSLHFTSADTLFQDYFVANCLREITPLKLQVSQLFFRSAGTERFQFVLLSSQNTENFVMLDFFIIFLDRMCCDV